MYNLNGCKVDLDLGKVMIRMINTSTKTLESYTQVQHPLVIKEP
jgi:hypothetical protein